MRKTKAAASNPYDELVRFWEERGGALLADYPIEFYVIKDTPHVHGCGRVWKEPSQRARLERRSFTVRDLAGRTHCSCLRRGDAHFQCQTFAPAFYLYDLYKEIARLDHPTDPVSHQKIRSRVRELIDYATSVTFDAQGEMLAAYVAVRDAIVEEARAALERDQAELLANRNDAAAREMVRRDLGLGEHDSCDETTVFVGLAKLRLTAVLRVVIGGWGVGNSLTRADTDRIAVLCMPVWALSWLWNRTRGASVEVVAQADEHLAPIAAQLWDPHGSGPLVRLWNAFEAAAALQDAQ